MRCGRAASRGLEERRIRAGLQPVCAAEGEVALERQIVGLVPALRVLLLDLSAGQAQQQLLHREHVLLHAPAAGLPAAFQRGHAHPRGARQRQLRSAVVGDRALAAAGLGNNIDWVFASNELAVPEWKVVARFDKQLRLKGVIPSDHFMVRATITLP